MLWMAIFSVLSGFYLHLGWGEYLVTNYPGFIQALVTILPSSEWLANNSPRFREQLIPIGFVMKVGLFGFLIWNVYFNYKYRKFFFYYSTVPEEICPTCSLKVLMKIVLLNIFVIGLFVAFLYGNLVFGSEVLLTESQLDNDSRIYLFRDEIQFNTIHGFVHIVFLKLIGPWIMSMFVIAGIVLAIMCLLIHKKINL